MPKPYNPLIVVLAAGLSKRFDGIKLLAKVRNGSAETNMLQHLLNKLESLELPVVVATGEYHQALISNIHSGADFHFCSQSHLGIGHTINQISHYSELTYPNASHLMIVLADQVAMTIEDYKALLNTASHHQDKIIYSKTDDGITAPAVFPNSFCSQLQTLSGDSGAKKIIKRSIEQTVAVELANAKLDIDQQQQLKQWNEQYERQA